MTWLQVTAEIERKKLITAEARRRRVLFVNNAYGVNNKKRFSLRLRASAVNFVFILRVGLLCCRQAKQGENVIP